MVVAGDVIEHLARPTELLRDIRRVLRPGGQLLLSVPELRPLVPADPGRHGACSATTGAGILDNTHLRFFTRSTLRRTVRAAGFDILEESATGLPLGAIGGPDGSSARCKAVRRIDAALVRLAPDAVRVPARAAAGAARRGGDLRGPDST